MNGIINILKPPGMTSFDVVGYLRGVLKTKKIGHTGTLDPGAVGVLPICVGSATKAIEFMTEKDKIYRAELTLGATTDTQDSTGQILEEREINVSVNEIEAVMKGFVGRIKQIPPMYSAVKIDGKKLYELARSGISVEREAREIQIYSIDIIDIDMNTNDKSCSSAKVLFDVWCSKGTYIRTLCADIGERLSCGGHMSFLIRLKAGSFDLESAVTLEKIAELADKKELGACFTGVETIFADNKYVELDKTNEKKFLNGAFVNVNSENFIAGQMVTVYNDNNNFLGLGEVVNNHGKLVLKSKKLFCV